MFGLVLSGKRYLIPSQGVFRPEPSSLHVRVVRAVVWTHSRTVEGAGARRSRSFSACRGMFGIWVMKVSCPVSIRVT